MKEIYNIRDLRFSLIYNILYLNTIRKNIFCEYKINSQEVYSKIS